MDSHLTIVETTSPNRLTTKVREALNEAILTRGKLSGDVLALDGMSGKKYRLFINNLVGSIQDARYLEVGVWKGSTFCSAIFDNKVRALAIDNWSLFGGPADQFMQNVGRFKGEARVSFLDSDFRAVDFSTVGKFNIYFFDGPHSEADQYDGLSLAQPALDDQFVLIVDDWNWPHVRKSTLRAIDEVGLQLDFVAEIRTTLDGTHPQHQGKASDWHNGYFIAACVKPPSD